MQSPRQTVASASPIDHHDSGQKNRRQIPDRPAHQPYLNTQGAYHFQRPAQPWQTIADQTCFGNMVSRSGPPISQHQTPPKLQTHPHAKRPHKSGYQCARH